MKIECRSQKEVDEALKTANEQTELHLFGDFSLSVSCSLTVVARGSSQPHVVALESSQPHVEAWESSQPHVEARGYVSMVLSGKIICKFTKFCHAVLQNFTGKITGAGTKVSLNIDTKKKWLDYYGVEQKKGAVVLYKAISVEYKSGYGFEYKPGSIPVAPDWDGGENECGGGLHFCPSPYMAKSFFDTATRFMACPIKVKDLRKPAINDQYPTKIKARCCCAPIWEVDISGEKIEFEYHTKNE